jgi:DNA-binding beta-propeller fold protein YncE
MTLALVAVGMGLSGCGSKNTNRVTVAVSPATATVVVGQTLQGIFANVQGATDTSVTWTCTFTTTATGGTASTPAPCTDADGTLKNIQKTTVDYVAPATIPSATSTVTVTITATANADKKTTGKIDITLDSGIRVNVTPGTATIGTKETFQFHAVVNSDPTNAVTWSVKEGDTAGKIDANGIYTAPASVPATPTATIIATAKKDTTRTGQATVTIVDSKNNQITFTGIVTNTAPLGGVLQDLYLNANNLRSTVSLTYTSPLGAATPIDPGQLRIIPLPTGICTASSTKICPSSALARLRLTPAQLSVPGTFTITITFPNPNGAGTISVSQNGTIVPYRPSIVSVPASIQQQNSGQSLTINGGLFGPSANTVISAQFNGTIRGVDTTGGPRKIGVVLNPGDLSVPGLFPVTVVNNNPSPTPTPTNVASVAATNIAVQPQFVGPSGNPVNPVALKSTIPLPDPSPGVHPEPSGIAIDSTLGIAAVTEQATNSVQLVNMNGGNPVLTGSPIAVGNAPTGVAIDDQLNGGHVAVVVNSGSNNLSLIGLPAGAVIGTVNLSGSLPTANPFAVGVDPNTHLALVAFSSTNLGVVVDLNAASGNTCLAAGQVPPCVLRSVTLNTGARPQIAFEPRIHLAFVTPGGSGQVNVVDLTQKGSTASISAAPDGAVRSGNIVTIKTTQTHNLNPLTPGTVVVSGVTPADFNGSFTVLQVLGSNSFTYSQAGPDETGGGGTIVSNAPFLTFNVSNTAEGIAINPVARTVVIADPNAGGSAFSSPIAFIGTLDQNVTGLGLQVGSFLKNPGSGPEIGARYVAFQPFTNVAVSLNTQRSEVSVLDSTAPQRLAPALSLAPSVTAGSYTPAGSTTPVAVNGAIAVDPATNLALVANAGVGGGANAISVVQLGTNPTKPIQISQVLIPQSFGVSTGSQSLAQAVRVSSNPVAGVRILGFGFAGPQAPQVSLDGSPSLPPSDVNVVSDREIDVTIPAEFLAAPRRFALTVSNNGAISNVADFTVVGVEAVSKLCTGANPNPQPFGVAIDDVHNIALVTNMGCAAASTSTVTSPGTVSIIDLNPGTATMPNLSYGHVINTIPVGAAPTGIAVIPRLSNGSVAGKGGFAVVANSGSNTVSILDLTDPPNAKEAVPDVTVGTSPNGVAIDPDTGIAIVANTGSNTASAIDLNPLTITPIGKLTATTVGVDTTPIAVATDPDAATRLAAVTTSSALDLLDISKATPSKTSATPISAIPTGIVFDPSTGLFYVTASGFNAITAFDPVSLQTRSIPVGINPTSLANNYQTGGILTVNSGSNTTSLIDSQTFKTRETLGISGSSQFAVAIHPRTNLAVIADQAHQRVILLPLP